LKNTFYVSPEDDVKRGEHKSFDRHLTVGKQNPGQQLIPSSRERLTNTLQDTLQRPVEPFQTSVALRMVGRCLYLDNFALNKKQLTHEFATTIRQYLIWETKESEYAYKTADYFSSRMRLQWKSEWKVTSKINDG